MRAVNLIPAEHRPGGGGTYGRSEGAAYVVTGFVAGIVLLACMYMLAHHQIADRQGVSARYAAEAQAATAQAAALAPYTGFISLRNQRLTAVEQLAGARFDWAHAIHELGRVLPLDVSLQSVTGTITGPTAAVALGPPAAGATGATGAAGAGAAPGAAAAAGVSASSSASPPGSIPAVSLVGCTTSQSEVARTLQRLQLIDGVTNVDLTSASNKGASAAATAPAAGVTGGAPTAICPVNFTVKVNYAPLPAVTLTTGTVGGGTPDSTSAVGAAALTAAPGSGATGTTGTTGATGTTGTTGAIARPSAAAVRPTSSPTTTPPPR